MKKQELKYLGEVTYQHKKAVRLVYYYQDSEGQIYYTDYPLEHEEFRGLIASGIYKEPLDKEELRIVLSPEVAIELPKSRMLDLSESVYFNNMLLGEKVNYQYIEETEEGHTGGYFIFSMGGAGI